MHRKDMDNVTPSEIREDIAKEKVKSSEPWPLADYLKEQDIPNVLALLNACPAEIRALHIQHTPKGTKITIDLNGFLESFKKYRVQPL